ncbi:MAG: type III-A CRISPR-associated protein Cas10/Csm1 [Anaerolineae bacterium]|nr:type III-A CRISPR-associated protein Cas10/Csm1 [Anaerolineae bacterium]
MHPTTASALAGLFDQTLKQFPELNQKDVMPAWWAQEVTTAVDPASLNWAVGLAAQGQPARDVLAQRQPRATIFTRLFQPTNLAEARYIPLQPLSLDALKPVVRPADTAVAYADLLSQLQQALTQCRDLDPEAYLITAQDILRRYTWCLPSPTFFGEEAAVSLYDFSRSVAALAPCYQAGAGPETAVATLISGDISGIQDFIYTITARGATPGLRGRSFYLQLLTEAVTRYVRRELGADGVALPPTSVIYSGGGHFYLLAPGDRRADVEQIRRQISQKLLPHHRDLYIGVGAVTLTAGDFAPKRFTAVWQSVSRAVSQTKNRRWSELDDNTLASLFAPVTKGGDKTNECRVCHYEWGAGEKDAFREDETRRDDDNDLIRKCRLCASLEELGNRLRDARYVLWRTVPPQTTNRRFNWDRVLQTFGAKVRLYQQPPDGAEGELWALDDAALEAPHTESHTESLTAVPAINRPLTLRYLVNINPKTKQKDVAEFLKENPTTPQDEVPEPDHVKTFTLLQFQARGIKRLGVLRMDVDNLGAIFQKGFGAENGLVQTAALSQAISLYFEGWISRLIQEIDRDGRDVLYAIYSGGDDLFIVGAWDLLPELAHRINSDFQKYAAGNPYLHASAGISLHEGKFPLYQAARAAATSLDAAKAYENEPGDKKNAFNFLGRTQPWAAFTEIQNEQAQLVSLVNVKEIGRNLLQHLLRLDTMYQEHVAEQSQNPAADRKPYWGRGQWLHVYQMTRLAGRVRSDSKTQSGILTLRDKLRGNHFTYIQTLGLAARWAELATRHEKEDIISGSENN